MSLPRFRAAVFDMDGLLLDSERPIRDAWMQATREFGVVLGERDYLDVVGRNEVDSRHLLQALLGEACSYDAVRSPAAVLIDEALGIGGYAAKAGVVALLEGPRVRRGPCVVAASTRVDEVKRRLQTAGLAPFFPAFPGGG